MPPIPMSFDAFLQPQPSASRYGLLLRTCAHLQLPDMQPVNTANPFSDQQFNLSQSSGFPMCTPLFRHHRLRAHRSPRSDPGMPMQISASAYSNQPPPPPQPPFDISWSTPHSSTNFLGAPSTASASYGQTSLDATSFGQTSLGFTQPHAPQQNAFNPSGLETGMLDESGGLDAFFAGLAASSSSAPSGPTADTAMGGFEYGNGMDLSALFGSQPVPFTAAGQAPTPTPGQQQQWWTH